MGFLRTVGVDRATGEVAALYREEQDRSGRVSEGTRVLTTRPDFLPAWNRFTDQVRSGYSLADRDWRLITLIAAKEVPSTACSLAYGQALIADLGTAEAVLTVHRDFRRAALDRRDVAMLEYAEKVARHAHTVTENDIDRLRGVGFRDEQIFDIALCAALRSFFSRLIDAVGYHVDDPSLLQLQPPEFREALAVGRPLTNGNN